MPKGMRNWCYKDVIAFLKANGFIFKEHRKGSHEAWINLETQKIVEPNFHGGKTTYPPRTMDMFVLQSGVEKDKWFDWANGKR
jgi:predicted RNA binding protein YcfA (HicA-like mRNA interferase family)